jgi:hypothetical protein
MPATLNPDHESSSYADTPSAPPSSPEPDEELGPGIEHQRSTVSYSYDEAKGWRRWRALRPGRGMYHDIRRRLPYYGSDITDAWTYRTVASTIRMYFVK